MIGLLSKLANQRRDPACPYFAFEKAWFHNSGDIIVMSGEKVGLFIT